MLFIYTFYVLCALCALLYFYTRAKVHVGDEAAFRVFQRTYMAVYLMAAAGDWLQGPHVYALYESYGMSKHQIELLFIAGFGSSMLFGTCVGSLADKYGRRSNCIIYGFLYGAACITKHFADFNILLLGRLLGGMATSILFSAFESWLVCEHFKRGFSEDHLSVMFSNATLGNSLIAILAGLLAQAVADYFGFVAPFDTALAVLMLMNVLLVFTWTENYGDASAAVAGNLKTGWLHVKNDRRVLCLGLVQSLFEGSMYVFVLEWTPALTLAAPSVSSADASQSAAAASSSSHRGAIPHGYIFATFMVAVMIGSSLFKLLTRYTRPESFMRLVLALSAVSLAVPVLLFPEWQLVIYVGFVTFEVCVGLFWPALGFMRGIYVPENARATVMNLFRVPLNLIVVGILSFDLPMRTIFACVLALLLCASLMQHVLYRDALATGFKGAQAQAGTSNADPLSKSPLLLEEGGGAGGRPGEKRVRFGRDDESDPVIHKLDSGSGQHRASSDHDEPLLT